MSFDGEVLFAVEEGRLIGEKGTDVFPSRSIEAAVDFMGSRPHAWAESWMASRRLLRKGLYSTVRWGWRDSRYLRERLLRETSRSVIWGHAKRRLRGFARDPVLVGHHLAHAFSVLPRLGTQPALVLVNDFIGEWESSSTYYWTGSQMQRLSSCAFPHSVGAFYHQAASHIGFGGRTGPGKLMALSAYGSARESAEIDQLWRIDAFGHVRFDQVRLPLWRRRAAWRVFASAARCAMARELVDSTAGRRDLGAADFAATIQHTYTSMLQQSVIRSLERARSAGLRPASVALAGGCALNCQANGALHSSLRSFGIELVLPAWPGDEGTAIGAALAGRAQPGGVPRCQTTQLGPPATSVAYRCRADDVRAATAALASGDAIALVSGRLEFGRRALGGRCLIMNPRHPEAKPLLNAAKGREPFMPFAAAVLRQDAERLFRESPCEFMTRTVQTRGDELAVFPGLAHPSGLQRAQLVRPRHGLLFELLTELRASTGHSAVMLTSLNEAGEAMPVELRGAQEVARRLGAVGVLSDVGWLPSRATGSIRDARELGSRAHQES